MSLLQESTSNILFSVCPTRPVQTVCILKHFETSDIFKIVASDVFHMFLEAHYQQ